MVEAEERRAIMVAALIGLITLFAALDIDYSTTSLIYLGFIIFTTFTFLIKDILNFEPIGIDDDFIKDLLPGIGLGVVFAVLHSINSAISIGIPLQVVGKISLILLVAPYVEEYTFRGFLQPFLESKTNSAVAILLTAMAFAGFHFFAYGTFIGANLVAFVTAFVFSILFSLIAKYTNNLEGSTIAHMIVNGVILAGTTLTVTAL